MSEDQETIAIANIAGLQEIAVEFDSSDRAVWNWTKRYDFPAPITRVSNRPVWDMTVVKAWYARQKTSGNGWKIGTRRVEASALRKKP